MLVSKLIVADKPAEASYDCLASALIWSIGFGTLVEERSVIVSILPTFGSLIIGCDLADWEYIRNSLQGFPAQDAGGVSCHRSFPHSRSRPGSYGRYRKTCSLGSSSLTGQ